MTTTARRALVSVALALTLALVGGLPAPAAEAQPYVITAILSLTGPLAFGGNSDVAAFHVLEAYTNAHGGIAGRPLKFQILDDESTPAVAVQLSSQVINAHGVVVLGSDTGALCNAMMPLFKNGPLMYCLVPSIYAPSGGYVFASTVALNPYVNGMIRYMRLRGWKRFAVLSSTDGSAQVDDTATKDALALPENKDLQIVDYEHFNPQDLSVSAQAERIKEADAQAVLVWTSGTPFGTVLRGLNDAGVALPVITSNANEHVAQLVGYGAIVPKQLYMPGPPYFVAATAPGQLSPTMKHAINDFYGAFKSQNAVPDDSSAANVWDASLMVIQALRKIGPNATATDLRNYLLGIKGSFTGIDGTYDFSSGDQHGLSDRAVVMCTWDPRTKTFVAVSGFGGVPLPNASLP